VLCQLERRLFQKDMVRFQQTKALYQQEKALYQMSKALFLLAWVRFGKSRVRDRIPSLRFRMVPMHRPRTRAGGRLRLMVGLLALGGLMRARRRARSARPETTPVDGNGPASTSSARAAPTTA
jgi:hypothetical protein